MDKKTGLNVLGKGDKGHQPGKQIWLLQWKTVKILGGEGAGQGGQEGASSGKKDKWEELVGSGGRKQNKTEKQGELVQEAGIWEEKG